MGLRVAANFRDQIGQVELVQLRVEKLFGIGIQRELLAGVAEGPDQLKQLTDPRAGGHFAASPRI